MTRAQDLYTRTLPTLSQKPHSFSFSLFSHQIALKMKMEKKTLNRRSQEHCAHTQGFSEIRGTTHKIAIYTSVIKNPK